MPSGAPLRGRYRPAPVEWAGIGAHLVALGLLPAAPPLVVVPLTMFLILCGAAPFLPRYGLFLPTVCRGSSGRRAVALTFDDGPDPATTPALLRLLHRRGAPATFFVVGRKVDRHPGLVRSILDRGHAVGNHTYRHDNLIMLRSRGALKREIAGGQAALASFGVAPLAFRPPVGITNPRLGGVLRELGLYNLTFTCRAGDWGNRRIGRLSGRILDRVRPDDIIALHDVRPPDGGMVGPWLGEIDRLLGGLARRGYAVWALSELIGRPVARPLSPAGRLPLRTRRSPEG